MTKSILAVMKACYCKSDLSSGLSKGSFFKICLHGFEGRNSLTVLCNDALFSDANYSDESSACGTLDNTSKYDICLKSFQRPV